MREKLHRLLDLYLDINETKAKAFLFFSGHVDNVSVYLHENGWHAGAEATFSKHEYYSGSLCEEKNIDALIAQLEKYAGGNK